MPHLALPALAAYLRARGVEVILRDLNLEVFEQVLTRDYLEQSIARLREEAGARTLRPIPPDALQWTLAEGPRLAAQIEEAVGLMRSSGFLYGPVGREAFLVVDQALELASLPFHPASLQLTRYLPPVSVESSRSLLQAVRDPQANMFLPLFQAGVLADLERERPDIVGISIPTRDQMLAGLTLAHLIRQAGLPCHVTAGGPHITMLREELPRVPELFTLFDSAVVFEGERPLARLAEALAGDGDLSGVPNLIYHDGTQIRVNAPEEPEPIGSLPPPDLAGLPIGRYLAPEPVLPLRTSRGCYHSRCAFCNVGYGRPAPYQQLEAGWVVEQMLAVRERYGARHIFFADEALSPHTLREMSRLLEELGSPFHWCGCARFEKALSQELLAGMVRGGCRMLLFGLETASEPIMRRLTKGTTRAVMSRILRQGAEAGLWNHVFFFFGFPGETMENAQETVDFVYAHQAYIHSASPGTFYLERYAPVERHPEQYGIRRIVQRPGQDLATGFDYEVTSGIDGRLAELVVSRLADVFPEKRFGQYYANDAYRLFYAGHLWEQGQPFPPWLVPEDGTA